MLEEEFLVLFDPKIERTCRQKRRERRQAMMQNLGNNEEHNFQNEGYINNPNNKALAELVVPQLDGFSLVL